MDVGHLRTLVGPPGWFFDQNKFIVFTKTFWAINDILCNATESSGTEQ